jgi:hypothetical protein
MSRVPFDQRAPQRRPTAAPAIGFTDRSFVPDASGDAAGGTRPADSDLPVTIVVNVISDERGSKAIQVADTTLNSVRCWLPRSQITIEPGNGRGLIRVTMPKWLAREKNLAAAVAAEGQGSLF